MQFTLLIDMDEVLTDFVSGALRVHGLKRDPRHGEWDLATVMGITQAEFVRPIAEEAHFWDHLDPLPLALTLACSGYQTWLDCNWCVVTDPSDYLDSPTGKVRWLKAFFGQAFDRFVITPHKHLLARPDRILIDDREANIRVFRKAGGLGIVYPTLGNNLHSLRHNAINYVKEQIHGIQVSQRQRRLQADGRGL